MSFKNKINFSVLFFSCLFVLFFVFLICPLFLEIKKVSQDFLSQRAKLVIMEEKAKNLETAKLLFREITPDLEKISGLFADSAVPVDFISFLEQTSRSCHLTIKISPVPSGKIEKDPWSSLSFQVTSASSFPNFLKFLEKLESGPYLIEIQNLNINRLTETELKSKEFEKFSLGDVRTNLSLKVYTK